MRRDSLVGVPEYSLPPECSLRLYRPGDAKIWTAIHIAADKYNEFPPQRFSQEFGHDEAVLSQRQFFLCAPDKTPIGTATAWWGDDWEDGCWGRIHWVAIVPQFQGRGLAKPLLSTVCKRLRALRHTRAYLTTSTARLPAINLYRRCGFVPHIRSADEKQTWRELEEHLLS